MQGVYALGLYQLIVYIQVLMILKSVLSTTIVHQFRAAWYKSRRRRPKHNSKRVNEEIECTLGNEQLFAIDVKGGGKAKRGS